VIDVSLPPWLITICLFTLGAVVGSFLNVCIYRIPTKENFWEALKGLHHPPSTCPRCKTRIAWHDNVPILGWLMLRGRCRTCRMRISPRYPLIELLNALLWVAVYWMEIPLSETGMGDIARGALGTPDGPHVIPGLGPFSPTVYVHLRFLFHIFLVEALLVASWIDIDLRIIPDASTVPAMVFGLVAAVAVGRLNMAPVYSQNSRLIGDFAIWLPEAWRPFLYLNTTVPEWCSVYPRLHALAVSVAGFIIGGGVVWAVRLIGFWVLKREAMGFGDVILMAMVGIFVGWQPVIFAFFIAPAIALIVVILTILTRRDPYIPYGPYLSIGTLLTILFWRPLWGAFQNLFHLGVLLIPLVLIMVVGLILCLMMVQGIKWALGFPLYPPEQIGVWSAADQNQYQAGENVDRSRGRWRGSHEWPGTLAARGQTQYQRWRQGR
jgi:leader peptidase (prepilin peptidase)/N-methyltransferase